MLFKWEMNSGKEETPTQNVLNNDKKWNKLMT